MKNLLFVAVATLLLASCVKSPEEKADALIKDEMQKTLFHPDTYAPSETKMDSAFAPTDDPEFYEKCLKYAKLSVVADKYNREAEMHKSLMNSFEKLQFAINDYNEEKAKYDEAVAKKEKAMNEMSAMVPGLLETMAKARTFIGFKAVHSYRAENNDGQTVGGQMKFLFDKDVKDIVASYDMESEEYVAVEYLQKVMRGENSMADEFGM